MNLLSLVITKIPTRKNILSAFRWLRDGAKAGDSLILHYSGHGGSVKDMDGDEEDGKSFDHSLPYLAVSAATCTNRSFNRLSFIFINCETRIFQEWMKLLFLLTIRKLDIS